MRNALVNTHQKHKTNKKQPLLCYQQNRGHDTHLRGIYQRTLLLYHKTSKAYLLYPNLGLGGYFYGKKESRWTIPGVENHQR